MVLILLFSFLFAVPDGKLHIVFCDVGQGDAMYVRFPDGKDALFDGGPANGKVLSCLGRHMPFYDRTIELVSLSHAQADHFGGLIEVFKRYNVELFLTSPAGNSDAKSYQELVSLIKTKDVKVQNVYTGDVLNDREVKLISLWPERSFITATITDDVSSNKVLGATTQASDLNDFSLVYHVRHGDFDLITTGDAEADILKKVLTINSVDISTNPIEVLKVPHHGSKRGLNDEIVNKLQPKLAVISVGKNSYGHPSDIALELLKKVGAQIKRTDGDGEVEVVSDGKSWKVK